MDHNDPDDCSFRTARHFENVSNTKTLAFWILYYFRRSKGNSQSQGLEAFIVNYDGTSYGISDV